MRSAALFLAAFALSSTAQELSQTLDCSDQPRGGPWGITFSSLTLTPDPPVKGQGAAWIAKSAAGPKSAVTGGSGTLIAELDGIPLYTSPPVAACGSTLLSLPLGTGVMNITSLQPCSAAAPIAAGTPVGMTMTLTLGTSIPGGNFAIIFKVKDQDAKGLYCANATFKI